MKHYDVVLAAAVATWHHNWYTGKKCNYIYNAEIKTYNIESFTFKKFAPHGMLMLSILFKGG